jgi:RluA family pseudouridine synthase
MKQSNSYLVNSIMTEWQINTIEDSLALSEALSLRVPSAPRAFLRQLCKKRRVSVNAQSATSDQIVHEGEVIIVKESDRWLECLNQAGLRPNELLYEDPQCVVINKSAGLAIHNAPGHDDDLLSRLKDFLRLRGETFQVAPIHRLDIGTSGAVLFGKGRASISWLGQTIMAGKVTKRYLALVEGEISQPGQLSSAVPAKGRIKEALTQYHPIKVGHGCTLLELELVTGRKHQIRRQLAESGWPILGDNRYNRKNLFEMTRPFLHCHLLIFPQPASGQTIKIHCSLPAELHTLLAGLDFPEPGDEKKTE